MRDRNPSPATNDVDEEIAVPSRRDRLAELVRRGGKEIVKVTAEDVIWWAKSTEREPFTSMATRLKRVRGVVDYIVWRHDGTMDYVLKEETTKPRRVRE